MRALVFVLGIYGAMIFAASLCIAAVAGPIAQVAFIPFAMAGGLLIGGFMGSRA